MPVGLDNLDVAILKALLEDGRKSFRAISREVKTSTPTVQARYQRLVNIGLIKSIRPEIDLSKLDKSRRGQLQSRHTNAAEFVQDLKKERKSRDFQLDINEGLKVRMRCDYCQGPIHDKPKVLRFANYERFFCCVSCKANYKEKYGGRIESLMEQYREESRKRRKREQRTKSFTTTTHTATPSKPRRSSKSVLASNENNRSS
jgi:DNA-binding Lrp family transcriptional regulator